MAGKGVGFSYDEFQVLIECEDAHQKIVVQQSNLQHLL